MTLRSQLGIAVIVLYMAGTVIVSGVAYRASRAALEREAIRSVSLVAESRERAIIGLLEGQRARLEGFLRSVESLCGERAPSGRVGWEDECVRVAVGGLHSAERATATELVYRGTRVVAYGGWRQAAEFPPIGQLAHITASAGMGEYTMQAVRGQVVLRTRCRLDRLDTFFRDQSGLSAHGEVFLTDRLGYFLTTPRFAIPARHPISMAALSQCLAGSTGEIVTSDYRTVPVISGFRPVGALGGGCIVANVTYQDALGPVYQYRSLFVYALVTLVVIGAVMASVIARVATLPISRLVASARALAGGDFDRPVPVAGSSEVRQLGQAFSTMARSIGELVQREQKARRDAEAANRTKDEFLAMLSHELRTPLNAILGWASILGRGHYDSARVTHASRVIERNARVQVQMIEDLLDVSRIGAGTQQLSLAPVSLASAVDSAVEVIRPAADAKRIELHRRIETPEKVLLVDAQRFQQILWNLLSNAVRFTPPGGCVEIAAREAEGGTTISVSDSGIGIAASFLPHVFERFRQADSSTTRIHGGLGLGLAIVRDLVQLHGGTVDAESAGEGMGTTFTLYLPAGAEAAAVAGPSIGRTQPVALDGARLLVVDDDADTREVLRAILEDAGAIVTVTRSAQETRTVLETIHPDLLIADIGMPEEDGYSLIRSIRTRESDKTHLPAIALTAHAGPQDEERALASGFQLHVAKPIDSSRLVASIASLVHTS